ncbi:MAG: acyltransferase family protein [Lachnospiraceae bacterium]|nr:acyltransferase family protein [Lachnospiraceae bacterium]
MLIDNVKNNTVKVITLFIVMLLCFGGMFFISGSMVTNSDKALSPAIDTWESRYIKFSDDGWYIDEMIFNHSGLSDDIGDEGNIEFIYGPFLFLEKGSYVVKINYECSDYQTVRIYSFENEDKISVKEPTVLSPEDCETCYYFTVNDDIDNFEVRVCYNGKGSLQINDISLYDDDWNHAYYIRYCLFILSLIFISFLLVILFRHRFSLADNRSPWIDLARGVGILLVLFGHTEGNPLTWFVYGFHMPFFFILSGFMYKDRPMTVFLKKLVKGYIIPYFAYCFANSLLRIPYMLVGPYSFSGVMNSLEAYWIGSLKGSWRQMPNCMPLWFLPTLAVSLFIFKMIQYIRSSYIRYMIYICLAITGYYWNFICDRIGIDREWPFGFHAIPTAVSFIATGYVLIKFIMAKADHRAHSGFMIIIPALAAGTVSIILNHLYFSNVDVYFNKYGNIVLMYLGAVCMSLALLTICRSVEPHISRSNTIAVIGAYSTFFFAFDFWGRSIVTSLPKMLPGIQFEWMISYIAKLALVGTFFVIWHLIKTGFADIAARLKPSEQHNL